MWLAPFLGVTVCLSHTANHKHYQILAQQACCMLTWLTGTDGINLLGINILVLNDKAFFWYSITQTSVWVQILRVHTWLYMLQIYNHFLPVNMSERSWSYWAPAAASGPSRDSRSIHHKSGNGSSASAREKRQGERGRITVQKVRERQSQKVKGREKSGKSEGKNRLWNRHMSYGIHRG